MFGPEVEKTAAFIQPLNSHHAEFFLLFFFQGVVNYVYMK